MIFVLAAQAGSVSGTVTGADASPLPSVQVVVYDARLNYADANTTNDGGYSIVGLPAGRYRMRALPDDGEPWIDRFYPDTWDYCAADVFVVGEDEGVDGVDIALAEGGSLSGRIVDSLGAPIVGAQVVAIGESERVSLVSRLAVADADGAFTVRGLDSEPGVSEPYFAYVAASGWPRQYLAPSYEEEGGALFDVVLGANTDVGDEPLLDGITVRGTATGPDGPLDQGTAFVYSGSQVLTVDVQADGTFEADGLPPGTVIPWIDATGFATTYYPDADRPGGSIAAPDEGTVVTGADVSLPYEQTLTITLEGEGDLGEVSGLLYNDTYTVGRGGGFDETGTLLIDGLHPGTYFLRLYASDIGYVDDYVRDTSGELLPIVVDGDTTITVPLVPAASFSGTVRGDDGLPVYGAVVYATTADGENKYTGVTDHDGVYTITGLVGGTYTLKADYNHYCPTDAGWLAVWWPDALVEEDALSTSLGDAEVRTNVDFTLFNDDDHDDMGDAWEAENGLDTTLDDASGDADEDGYLNIEEWLNGTDPTDESAVQDCGCGSGAGALVLLPLAVLRRRAAKTGTPRSRALRW